MAYTQDNRFIRIDTPLGKDVLLLRGFTGEEGISRLFAFDLDLLSEDPSIGYDKIVGQNVTITTVLADDSERYFNGFVSRFAQGGSDHRFTYYRAQVVPWLWFLTRTADCRIFQNKTIPDIIIQIFKDLGFQDFKNLLQGSFEPREYCVQYRETDFNFVSRLMEQYGIFYFFEHEKGKHTLMLANSPSAHKVCPGQAKAKYDYTATSIEQEDVITDWEIEQELRPGKYALTDFNFETPGTSLMVNENSMIKVGGNSKYEVYDFPGEYLKRPQGEQLVKIRMQEEEEPASVVSGASICRAFAAGYRFDLEEHYRQDLNKAYLITSVQHDASVGDSYETDQASETRYSNRFTCIPHAVPYRPLRVTPKPVVQGSQTAIVVGKAGEEIWTDKYGRVKVQFHWDREGEYNEKSSCWIRVAQIWAGKQWGGMFIPRIGQEVIVDFLEGDPDQPIITGRVYNFDEMPPYKLPDEQTKSTVKSLSSKGGGGFNEIRFEDKKGEEQVFIHGEKDLDVRIKNDRREWIGRDRHLVVKRDKVEEVDRDEHIVVKRDLVEKVDRDHHLQITGKQAIKVTGSHSFNVQQDVIEEFKMNHSEQVTMNYYLKGMNVVIEGMTGLTIKVGGNFISINPGGIQIMGMPFVLINSGGAPLPGMPGMLVPPTAPLVAEIADQADPGSKDTTYKSQRQAATAGLSPATAGLSPATAAAAAAAANAPSHDPNAEENKDKKSWIEIELVDEDNKPVPGEKYRVTLPDGTTVAEGTLGADGRARVEHIDPGSCKVTFPDLDKEAWGSA